MWLNSVSVVDLLGIFSLIDNRFFFLIILTVSILLKNLSKLSHALSVLLFIIFCIYQLLLAPCSNYFVDGRSVLTTLYEVLP